MIGLGELAPLLAQLEVKLGQPLSKVPGLLMRDVVLIVTIGVCLLLAGMALVRYFYRRRRKKKHVEDAQRVYRESNQPEEKEPEAETPESRRRYKYRWKRRGHRTRNPTLAETGGLPPPRRGEPTQPS
ncbi:MAG: hypothetical protein HYY23_07330 [Verrucomicrobia bacterium]|nr:hypothetical protein [Verrucomicrobiota bacterium]